MLEDGEDRKTVLVVHSEFNQSASRSTEQFSRLSHKFQPWRRNFELLETVLKEVLLGRFLWSEQRLMMSQNEEKVPAVENRLMLESLMNIMDLQLVFVSV